MHILTELKNIYISAILLNLVEGFTTFTYLPSFAFLTWLFHHLPTADLSIVFSAFFKIHNHIYTGYFRFIIFLILQHEK